MGGISKRADEIAGRLHAAFAQKGSPFSPPLGDAAGPFSTGIGGDTGSLGVASGSLGTAAQIASNPRQTAAVPNQASLQDYALGGGKLGKIGVTPEELSAGGGRKSRSGSAATIQFNTGPAADSLQRAIQEIVLQLAPQLMNAQ